MILMKDIIIEGHPTLTKKAQDINLPLSFNHKKLAKDLLGYVKNSIDPEMIEKYDLRPSVGIAAPQVNESIRMFAVHVYDFNDILHEHILINPIMEVLDDSIIYLPGGEGCLSIERETIGLTPRYNKIKITAHRYDPYGDIVAPVELYLEGYIGIIFQHEYDHLEGVLFTEKLYDELPNAKPAYELTNL